jgi:hypothetical protein
MFPTLPVHPHVCLMQVQRTLTVVGPCGASGYLCSGVCSNLPCNSAAGNATATIITRDQAPPGVPPVLSLVLPDPRAFEASYSYFPLPQVGPKGFCGFVAGELLGCSAVWA